VRRRGTHRRSIWILVSLVALAAALVPSTASAVTTTNYSIQSSAFKVAGSPYAWSFSASRFSAGGQWSLSISARRTAHNGKASLSHSWNFQLPTTDIVISSNLATVSINTHADLDGTGAGGDNFGSIVMHLVKKTKLHTTNTKCKKTHKLLFSSSTRTGTLGGTFDFKPNAAAGLPTDVKKSPIGVTVNKFVNTGRNCPGGGGGGGGGGGCATSKSFSGGLNTPFFNMSAIPTGKTSFMTFGLLELPAPAPALGISHTIGVTGPASAVKIANTGTITISGAPGTPFLSNTKLTYNGGSSVSSKIGKCKIITITDVFHSGGLAVNFGVATVTLNAGNHLDRATTSRVVKA
jgi:hypothetical protein